MTVRADLIRGMEPDAAMAMGEMIDSTLATCSPLGLGQGAQDLIASIVARAWCAGAAFGVRSGELHTREIVARALKVAP